jgi:ERCC4-type nuclease
VRLALLRLGVTVEYRPLAVGDYQAGRAIVERKSVRDLHLSIIQVDRLRRLAAHPYVLVEGADLDAGPLRPEAVRGALVALAELGVPVVRSSGPEDSASWLKISAGRRTRRRQPPTPMPRPRTNAAEAMLAAVPGLSIVSARALLAHFGSVANIAEAGEARWLSVPGIGPVRAAALAKALNQEPSISSRRPSRRRGPST